jgi:hypothetical protein
MKCAPSNMKAMSRGYSITTVYIYLLYYFCC